MEPLLPFLEVRPDEEAAFQRPLSKWEWMIPESLWNAFRDATSTEEVLL